MTRLKDANIESLDYNKLTNKPSILTQTDISNALVGLIDDRGDHSASANLFPTTGGSGASGAILKGDLWRISVAGTLGGIPVEVEDTIRAKVDNPGTTASNWVFQQGNITTTVRVVKQDHFVPTANQTAFTLTQTPALGFPVSAWHNGVHQTNLGASPDFTVSGSTLTWSVANSGITNATSDKLVVEYWY